MTSEHSSEHERGAFGDVPSDTPPPATPPPDGMPPSSAYGSGDGRNGFSAHDSAPVTRRTVFDDPMEPSRSEAPMFHGYPDSFRADQYGTVEDGTIAHDGSVPPPETPIDETAPAEEPAPVVRRRSSGHLIREIVETVILAAVIFLAVRAVVQNFKVEGSSMVPSFIDGEYMLVNKAVYARIDMRTVHKFLPFISAGSHPEHYVFHGPQHGDVIVFHPPPAAGGDKRDFIKRVIGVPGDTIDFRDNHVVVNGAQLPEPYIAAPTNCQGQFCHVTLGNDQYFVMGDNRTNSSDSRFWGPVQADKIIGKALVIYWCGGRECSNGVDHVGLAPNHHPATAKPAK